MSIKQYILQRRVAEAKCLLLEESGLTVKAVSARTGFSDFSLFNRKFKDLTGMTATAYRRLANREHSD